MNHLVLLKRGGLIRTFRRPFLSQDKHRAENQTDRGSRFGQKPIPKAGGKDYL